MQKPITKEFVQQQQEMAEVAVFWNEIAQHLPKSIERAALGDEAICNAFRAAYPQMKATIIANIGRELEARCEEDAQKVNDGWGDPRRYGEHKGLTKALTLIRSITGIK